MLGNKNIIAFIATMDVSKARPFYEDVLGLKVTGEEQYAVVFDANGTQLRMSLTKELIPDPHTVLGWVVDDIKETIAALTEKGVEFATYDWFEQDEHNIWTSPDGTLVAWFRDPDGNLLSLTEFNKTEIPVF